MSEIPSFLSAGTSLLTGIGNLIQGSKNRKLAVREAEKNRSFQTSEREASQKWQDDQTKRNLKYQTLKEAYDFDRYYSPVARMDALKKAGINPDLAYGSAIGSGMAGSAVSTPSAAGASPGSMPDLASPISQQVAGTGQIADAVSSAASVYKTLRESKNIDSITMLNGSRVRLTDAQTGLTKEDTKRVIQQYKNMTLEAGKIDAEIKNLLSTSSFLNASEREKNQIVDEMRKTFDLRFDSIKLQYEHDLSELHLNEEALNFLRETLGDRIDSLRFAKSIQEVQSLEAQQQWRFSQQWNKVSDKEWKTNARIIYDTVMASLTSNSALLENQLDIQKGYGKMHAVSQICSEFIRAIGAAVTTYGVTRTLIPSKTVNKGKGGYITVDYPQYTY